MKNLARATALAVAVCALLAVGASSAMAEQVATKFSANTIKLTGTGLTVKKNGAEPKTCDIKTPATGTANEASGTASAKNNFWLQTELSCTTGKFSITTYSMIGRYETTTGAYTLLLGGGETSFSPWGDYYPGYYGQIVGTWTNGSGLTPSTISFNEFTVGGLTSNPATKISLTGTIKATTSTGGLLTLSH